MTETQQAAVIHNICVDMLLLYNFKSHVLNMTYVNFILPTVLLITGIACQTGLSRLMIQVYLKEDLINIGSISILYMTFEHRLKEPEVAVILAIQGSRHAQTRVYRPKQSKIETVAQTTCNNAYAVMLYIYSPGAKVGVCIHTATRLHVTYVR